MALPVKEFRANIRKIEATLPEPAYIISQEIPYITNPAHKAGVVFVQDRATAAWRIAEGTHRPCTAEEVEAYKAEMASKVEFYKQQAADNRMKDAVMVSPNVTLPPELTDAMTKALSKK